MTLGYGSGGYGGSPWGSLSPALTVSGASAIDGTHVAVNFSTILDPSFPPLLSPSNYTIVPPLTILSVSEEPQGVVLTTTPQAGTTYTVTVIAARSVFGTLLDPAQNSATFAGIAPSQAFFAVATGATRVRAVFSQVMLNDSNLSNPANYTVATLTGSVIPVLSATPEQATNPVSVLLTLGTSLVDTSYYVCTINPSVHTALGLSILPAASAFQWLSGINQFQVPLGLFSGEVEGGLFGDPDGLVFFSPALNVTTPNSIIQIDEVDVCTTAYDSYIMPAPIDPLPLYTYGGSIVPTPSPDPYVLNQTVLWAPFPRNFEAKIELGFTGAANQDRVPVPVDNSCSVLLRQQFALGYVALLNDPAWFLFDHMHGTSVPPTFITAKNLAPIPPGPESILILHVQLSGNSNFAPATAKKIGHTSSSMAGTSKLVAGNGPPPVVLADAAISAGASVNARAGGRFAGVAGLHGQGVMTASATEGGPPPTVIFASSSVVAFGTVRRAAVASISAGSSVTAHATVTRGAVAHPVGAGAVTATLTAHWKADAGLAGHAGVTSVAKNTHGSQAIIVGNSSVSATHL